MKDLKEIVKRLDSLGTELYNRFGSDSYLLRCDLHDIKADLLKIDFISSSKVVLTETQDNCLELRKEILEFMEANNYFISTLKTKKNAIGIVDSYLKNYKG